MKTYYFDCQCNFADHTLRFTLDPEDGSVYTEVQLRNFNSVFKRIWMAIKYIFGYECKYGYYDCTLLKWDEYNKLRNLLDESETIRNEIRKPN